MAWGEPFPKTSGFTRSGCAETWLVAGWYGSAASHVPAGYTGCWGVTSLNVNRNPDDGQYPYGQMQSVILDGYYYVIGGVGTPQDGSASPARTLSCERYSFADGTWEVIADLAGGYTAGPIYHGVATDGTYVYVAGGESVPGAELNAVARYDPATNTWTALATLPARRTAGHLHYDGNGYLWWVSGSFVSGQDDVYRYEIATNTWTTGYDGMALIRNAASVIYDGKIYQAGGFWQTSTLNTRDFFGAYDIATDTYSSVAYANLPVPLHSMGMVARDGKIYVFGGFTNTGSGDVANTKTYVYDIATNAWSDLGDDIPTGAFLPAFVMYDNDTAVALAGNTGSFVYVFAPGEIVTNTATQDAADRLRSSVSETTGSLLDAVDVRAVDASVQEAYSYAQRLEPQTLTAFREVLRERDSATVDARYYPRPRQNSAMENRYDGVTVLSRLANWYPPRAFGTVTELGITSASTATAQEIITWLLADWATLVPWLTYETVPDLRYRTPDEDYASGDGIATTAVLAIAQDGNNRKTALEVLRDLLSPFPGTVLRQNSTGKLEIVPVVGPDADATPHLTLNSFDVYSVSIGEPDPFDIVNRATFTCSSWERSTGVEVMQPAYFQVGSLLNMGRAVWYAPPSDRLNLQPSETGTILQEDDMTPASSFTQQTPGLWSVGSSSIPAGTGIGLRDGGNNPTVTLAWSLYTDDGSTTPKETGTDGLSLLEDEIPFDGVWRDTIQWSRLGGSGIIQCRWNADRQGVEFRLGAWDLEANCFFAPCDGFVVEFTLNDYSVGYAQRLQRTGTFGVTENGDTIPSPTNTNAIEDSQTEFGVLERTVNVTGYSFTASQLAEMARGFVLANITPKVTREVEVSALTGFRVLFDDIGRLVQLPNGDSGLLTGVEYNDDFTSRTVSKIARVQVNNLSTSGALDTATGFHINELGAYWLSVEAGLPIETEASGSVGTAGGIPTTSATLVGVGSSSTSLATYPKTGSVSTGDIWVDASAPSGGSGTSASPYNSLTTALAAVSDGQRVIVRGGTITLTSTLSRSTNWATGIEVFAYGSERVTIDMSNLGTSRALSISGQNEHWKGFDFRNGNGGAVIITGSNNVIEDCTASRCGRTGNGGGIFYVYGSGATGNQFRDCAAWRNGDGASTSTNVPDNFKVLADDGSVSTGNVFARCFSANAPDDGFDLYRGNGNTIVDSVSYRAGKYWNGSPAGDGSGFKLGGGVTSSGNNTALGCIAIDNKLVGFDQNSALVAVHIEHCTTTGNDWVGYRNVRSGGTFKNNISFGDVNIKSDSSIAGTFNTWTIPVADPLFANAGAFDYSLGAGSSAIGAADDAGNLGASEVALEVAKRWLAEDLTS